MLYPRQHHLLKKICRSEKYYFSENEKKIIFYLSSLGFVTVSSENGDRWGNGAIKFCKITEAGKIYLYETWHQLIEKWIPYIITTAISVLALMKSYGYGIDDIIIWCMKQ